MPPLDTIGNTGAIQQTTRKSWDFSRGETVTVTHKGLLAAIESLYSTALLIAGSSGTYDSVEVDYNRGVGTLTLATASDGNTIYELYANEISLPVQSHPAFDGLTEAQKAEVLRVVHTYEEPTFTGDEAKLYTLCQYTETYYISMYVLRETKYTTLRGTIAAAFSGVDTVTSIPYNSSVNTIIGTLPTLEWLKKSPVVRRYGVRRWELTTEWWGLEKWSALLYGGTGSP